MQMKHITVNSNMNFVKYYESLLAIFQQMSSIGGRLHGEFHPGLKFQLT